MSRTKISYPRDDEKAQKPIVLVLGRPSGARGGNPWSVFKRFRYVAVSMRQLGVLPTKICIGDVLR